MRSFGRRLLLLLGQLATASGCLALIEDFLGVLTLLSGNMDVVKGVILLIALSALPVSVVWFLYVVLVWLKNLTPSSRLQRMTPELRVLFDYLRDSFEPFGETRHGAAVRAHLHECRHNLLHLGIRSPPLPHSDVVQHYSPWFAFLTNLIPLAKFGNIRAARELYEESS